MKRRIIKALSFAFALVMLLSVFLLPASAAVAPIINPMLDTYVVDDLVAMNYSPSHYPSDPSAEFLQVIHFLEYGYSSTDLRYYGLYLYLYNPSGKEIELNGSYLQMSYSGKDGSESKYLKYPLEVISYSIDDDNEYVFYKLKVSGINSVGRSISPGKRVYNLANLEILYKGEDKVVTKSWEKNEEGTRKNVWSYTGFQANFGSATNEGTLCYYVDELDTIPVEMHDASWYSDTSSLGEYYRWEVKSYYFNIPYSYIMKYGNPTIATDDTDGLVKVTGEYYKYGVNGLIVPDEEWYDKFEGCVDWHTGTVYSSSFPSFFKFRESTSSGNNVTHTKNYYDFTFNAKLNIDLDSSSSSLINYSDKIIYKYMLLSQGSTPNIDNETFTALWEASGKPILAGSGYLYMGSNTTGIGTRQELEITVDDDGLEDALTTYASTKKDGFGKWLDKLFNKEMYTDEDGYLDCAPLIQITGVPDYQKDAYVGKELYLDYESYLELKDFYNEKALNLSDGIIANSIYLMRVAVEPYYESEVTICDSNGSSSTGYYYEKVIHKDTDIFSFTFQNSKGEKQTVPVDCDPVDNLGSVVAGSNKDDSNPNGYPGDPTAGQIIKSAVIDLAEFIQSLKGIVILVGSVIIIIVVAVLVIVFWKYLEPWFYRAGNLLGKLGRGLGGVLGFLFKLLFYPLIFIWNIAVMILSIWFPFVSVLRINMSFGGKSGGSDDSKYYYEDRKYKQAEERRRQERHEAEMKELERRSHSKSGNSAPKRDDSKPSYGDSDDFFNAAINRTYGDDNK